MKYCLATNKETVLDGYTMIVVHPNIGFDINSKIEDATATELIAENILQHYNLREQDRILTSLAQKLRRGGKLVVSCNDVDIFLDQSRDIRDLIAFNVALFGETPVVKSISDVTVVKNALIELGLNVTNVRFDGFRAVVTAIRP